MTEEVYAFDAKGNRVFPCIINTICPVQHAEEGAEECLKFMREVEGCIGIGLEEMLNLKAGTDEGVTHVLCSREAYTHQADMLAEYLAELPHAWIRSRLATFDDKPEEIKTKLSAIVGPKEEVLAFLGLKEVS